ncbi:formate dehydrogenase accessory sulfurtransferase FdhD [Parvicella tangerina]|uniref:Sulfur carrier protein FdhD n=1 Tax=Parvicella tangerina TaxID=2829795 RepID=A0A916NHH3_9FLAO|nr:formate dehydrogenase accessory sulfurtransferase FdhD [Parvicella tangerina]CAG5081467.1 Sulfur carrier protein FdhD [Parvicella tangerina]
MSTIKGVKIHESQRFEQEQTKLQEEPVTEEKPLRILINEEPFTVTMRTPGLDKELVIGLLYNEDIVRSMNDLVIILSTSDQMDTAEVTLPTAALREGYMSARNFLSVSSCGVCGKTNLPEISGQLAQGTANHRVILSGLKRMRERQEIFEQTGGCHSAAVLDSLGSIIAIAEDIGRHNAVDKVIGSLLLEDHLKEAQTLLVSGRISYEIVIKCFRAKIPVLAAVSAPSSLAIDYAKELGITLFAFCRENRLTRFS